LDTSTARLADAHADIEDAAFVVIGVPYDATASFRHGAREGPAAIRRASYNFETWLVELGVDLEDVPVHDAGDVAELFHPGAIVDEVEQAIAEAAAPNVVPVIIGGEHNATEGAVRALGRVHEDLAVVALDAHLDFREQYMGESRSHACALRRCADFVGVDRIAVVGVRSVSTEELEDAQDLGLSFATADRVREDGIEAVLEELLSPLGDIHVYLSIDLDVLDPCHAPAVQNPEPFGISPLEVRRAMDRLAPRVVGLDVMECAPMYDGGQSALVAARLLRHAIGAVWLSRRSELRGPA
jgi:agmatinase